MDDRKWLQIMTAGTQIISLLETNPYTERFGLRLSEEDAGILEEKRLESLSQWQRVEFGEGILNRLIFEFCDSAYISQDNYVETIAELQNIFYHYKNEMLDEISDEELLHFMKEQFENVCFGDLEYLEGTCLEIFSEAVRAGYRGYRRTDGRGEYGKFDRTRRWDKELYLETLRDLCWR